jgi:glycosyltransferase involved in cell wall biosynthesis
MDVTNNNQKSATSVPQEELRAMCWEIGKRYPAQLMQEGIAVLAVYPHQAFIQWHVNDATSAQCLGQQGVSGFPGKLIIRIYDVTDIVFDGFNAHVQFDIEVRSLSGNYYLKADRFERVLLAEIGFRCNDGKFVPFARSSTQYFDRPRRSSRRELSTLFVGQKLAYKTLVPNFGCAPVFERLMQSLKDIAPENSLSVALFVNEITEDSKQSTDKIITSFAISIVDKSAEIGAEGQLFKANQSVLQADNTITFEGKLEKSTALLVDTFYNAHAKHPFTCIQCHDWRSLPAAITSARKFNLPLLYVIHSVQHLKDDSAIQDTSAQKAIAWEMQAGSIAKRIVVPSSAGRDVVIQRLNVPADRVVVIPDNLPVAQIKAGKKSIGIRQQYQLEEKGPIGLFAGEIAHHTGADLLMDVIPGICNEFPNCQFVFAGNGPLRGELEFRVNSAGIGNRCRFIGDVPSESFNQLISVCDFVVIPGRTSQDSGLVQLGLGAGKPVLATHQSNVQGITHGVNGYLVYDNPGSIAWGLKEMLNNPPGSGPLIATVGLGDTSIESIAAQYITLWATVAGGNDNV